MLSQLPPEIINYIIIHLSGPDLGSYFTSLYDLYSLRLTCRALDSKTIYGFSKAAFSTLTIDFSLQSLDRLHHISQHPHFRKAVRRIYFAHDASQRIQLGVIDEEEEASLEQKIINMLKEGMVQIFKGLPNLGSIIIINPFTACFSYSWEADTIPKMVEAADSELSDHGCAKSSLWPESYSVTTNILFNIILEAAGYASTPLSSLEVQSAVDRERKQDAYSICIHAFLPQHDALRHLSQLRMLFGSGEADCACPQRRVLPHKEPLTRVENALSRTLRNMPHLTVLYITFTNPRDRDVLRRNRIMRSLCALHLPQLTAFGLTSAPGEQKPLEQFLVRHKDRLEILFLRDIRLVYLAGGWKEILMVLLKNNAQKLKLLTCTDLYLWRTRILFSVGRGWGGRIHFEGPNIAQGLYSALIDMRYDY